MGITVQADGSFANTQRFLRRLAGSRISEILHRYGPEGVAALSAATPVETGETAHSWTYEVRQSKGSYEIVWKNTHVVNGANIALLIQYGHGTGTGGYVPGRDYINPAMKPVFDKILAEVRRVVTA
jgi:hypothetical protein